MEYTCACRFPYPPEVFPVGLFGDVVFGVDFSLQGSEASPLRDVFFAEHTCYLEHIQVKFLDFTSNVKYRRATFDALHPQLKKEQYV